MLTLLGSLTKNGWRETLRILRQSENTILKQQSQPKKKYAHIRRRDGKGKKTRAAAFQLVEEQGGAGAAKRYQRVKDGKEDEDEEIWELVLEKKTVVSVGAKGQGQRVGRREKEKEKEKRRVRVEERELRVGICCLRLSCSTIRLAWGVRWLNSLSR
jgi:hypothetical protein